MSIRRFLPGLVLGSLLLAGCTDQDVEPPAPTGTTGATETTEPSVGPTDVPPTPTEPAPTEQPTPTEPAPDDDVPETGPYDAEPKQSEGFPTLGDVVLLPTEVRVAHHDGYDRVVVEFDGAATPGYRAQYVDDVRHPGSGEPLDVPGSHVMEVIITGNRMPEEGESFARGEFGSADATHVQGVVFSPPFEGQSLMAIGVDGEQPFTVQTLDSPSRLVIDVRTD